MDKVQIGTKLEDALSAMAPAPVASVVAAIAQASVPIVSVIRGGPLAGPLGAATGTGNADGDAQKALDVLADRQFSQGLKGSGVRAMASEELDEPLEVDTDGTILVAIDPLDGSSNIDTNVSIGTIFSLLAAPPDRAPTTADFLQPGVRQLAAGFIIYGPQTSLVFTTGVGVHMATLDPLSGSYVMTRLSLIIPEGSPEFAINASNYRHWHRPVQAYVDDCIEGADGPRGKNFNMRWIASLVADAYRIFMRGGVFLYPADRRKGYESGRLRHVYEASPIALLVEQAGGQATNGVNRILDLVPASLHARVPLIFGSSDKVTRIRRYHVEASAAVETSPLFGKRGLLRG
ncbi:MAG TPA: class 1 fructose-bisphosphatase [Beijerinckiaceae bacterium]|nr:class 1 fructose-bisphosphatase [Beijerinckiaceae bacterium]